MMDGPILNSLAEDPPRTKKKLSRISDSSSQEKDGKLPKTSEDIETATIDQEEDALVDGGKAKAEKLKESTPLTEAEIEQIRNSGGVMGDEQFLWEIIEATKKSARDKLIAIDTALRRSDWTAVARHCHTLKGSTVMVDMKKLWAAAVEGDLAFKALAAQSATEVDGRGKLALENLRLEVRRLENTKREL